jgi:hypothetical protein
MSSLGRSLIVLGLVIAGVGVALTFADKIPWLGRLPGDIAIKRDNWSFYFPLTTSIVISIVLSLILYLFRGR